MVFVVVRISRNYSQQVYNIFIHIVVVVNHLFCCGFVQINLATRDKATALSSNYPVFVQRPGSASVTLTTPSACLAAATRYSTPNKSNKFSKQLQQQILIKSRSVSADCKYFQNSSNLKNSLNNSCAFTNNKLCCIQQKVMKLLVKFFLRNQKTKKS